MSTLLLSQRVKIEENKEYSDILNTVDINKETQKLYTLAVSAQYKTVSETISSVKTGKQDVRVKSLKELMQESVFHGAGWLGRNFIA